jgi:gamma-glutamyltranspeptidase / glutathione hydrolase
MIRSTWSLSKVTPRGCKGMVVAEHPLGAEVGASVLARGGNAIDAAVATAFAMPIIEPFMSSLAGGGSFLVHDAKRGETMAIDANVEAPSACHERCYELGEGIQQDLFTWRRVVGDANICGSRSVAVPGSVAGLCLLLERYGTMDLADVLAPAIRLAEEGVVPDWYIGLTLAIYSEEIRGFPETARTYLRNGHDIYRPPCLADGDVLRQPDLGHSLRLLAKEGPTVFYRGEIAQQIHEHMRATGGWLSKDDLAAYTPRVLPPLTGRYRGVELAFTPGATGGVTALQILNLWAQFPSARVRYATAAGLHLRAEAVRYAFEDRLRLLADALRVSAPWNGLTSPAYAAAQAKGVKAAGPRRDVPVLDPWAHESADSGKPGRLRPAPARRRGPAGGHSDCTTHIGVIDRQHNMVSLTNTAVGLFGARMVVPGTGILLNNGMIWFDPEPGAPNSIRGGKRPLVNMVPVLAFRKGEPYFTLGAPGGRKIVSVIPQILSNLIDVGDSVQAAMEAPRLHTEGSDLWIDDRVGPATIAALEKMGHPVVPKTMTFSAFFFARPVMVRIARQGLQAGLDPWSDAAAAGV